MCWTAVDTPMAGSTLAGPGFQLAELRQYLPRQSMCHCVAKNSLSLVTEVRLGFPRPAGCSALRPMASIADSSVPTNYHYVWSPLL